MKANNATEKVILDYFENNASDDLKKRVEAEKKTIEGALKYCSSQARKHQVGNCACVDDATVFGWVMHYFEDEDAKKWEKSPETAKVKAGAAKKKPAAKKPEEKKEPGWKKASAEGRRRAAEQRKAEAEAKEAETAKVDNAPQNALEAAIDRATGYKPGDEARTEDAGNDATSTEQTPETAAAEEKTVETTPTSTPPIPKRPPVLAVRTLPPIPKRERRERDAGQLFLFDQTAEGGQV